MGKKLIVGLLTVAITFSAGTALNAAHAMKPTAHTATQKSELTQKKKPIIVALKRDMECKNLFHLYFFFTDNDKGNEICTLSLNYNTCNVTINGITENYTLPKHFSRTSFKRRLKKLIDSNTEKEINTNIKKYIIAALTSSIIPPEDLSQKMSEKSEFSSTSTVAIQEKTTDHPSSLKLAAHPFVPRSKTTVKAVSASQASLKNETKTSKLIPSFNLNAPSFTPHSKKKINTTRSSSLHKGSKKSELSDTSTSSSQS